MNKRRRKDWLRAYGGEERVAFVAAQRCCVCGAEPPSENAHVLSGGMGRKADARWIVPLCWICHERYHRAGKLSLLQHANKAGGLRVWHPFKSRGWSGARSLMRRYDAWEDVAAAIEAIWQAQGA